MSNLSKEVTIDTSEIWNKKYYEQEMPGLYIRTTCPENPDGVALLMEIWDKGTEEEPHWHPGDDMTIVLEGKISVQFYEKQNEQLVKDGNPITISQGQTGYIKAKRIHDTTYLEDCKLVFVHDRTFGFHSEGKK